MNDHLLMVVYDSVTNSVFESQVFVPLVRMVKGGEAARVTLVTFECDLNIKNKLSAFTHPAITFIVLKRYPLLGIWSLRFAAKALRTLMGQDLSGVRARGPLAGLIVKYAGLRVPLVIQARGLCTEEYRFTSEQKKLSWFQKIVVAWRTKLYDKIEQEAYQQAPRVMIEAVSEALGEHLQKQYATPASMITLAQHDLVEMLPADFIVARRKEIRSLLKIPADAYVFCYSGSCKPWQCAEETVQFFAQEAKVNQQAFFLILSQDVAAFQALQVQYQLPAERVCLLAVKPIELLRYLCAADAGMLLRKPDVVNWVSRPTKLLEYQAVGLRVVHNGTIGMLARKT